MDVEDPFGKRVEQGRTDEPHEPGQAYEINAVLAQAVHNRAVVAQAVSVPLRIQVHGVDARLPRPYEPGRVRTVRDDHRDAGIELAPPDRVDDRLEIAPPPGDEDT